MYFILENIVRCKFQQLQLANSLYSNNYAANSFLIVRLRTFSFSFTRTENFNKSLQRVSVFDNNLTYGEKGPTKAKVKVLYISVKSTGRAKTCYCS